MRRFSGNSYLVELHRRVHFHHYNRQFLDSLGFVRLVDVAAVYERVTAALRRRNGVLASAMFKTAVAGMVEAIQKQSASSPERAASNGGL